MTTKTKVKTAAKTKVKTAKVEWESGGADSDSIAAKFREANALGDPAMGLK